MPWTAEEFRRKHNKRLTLREAGRAVRIAEAIVRRGGGEGMAIASANAAVKRKGKR